MPNVALLENLKRFLEEIFVKESDVLVGNKKFSAKDLIEALDNLADLEDIYHKRIGDKICLCLPPDTFGYDVPIAVKTLLDWGRGIVLLDYQIEEIEKQKKLEEKKKEAQRKLEEQRKLKEKLEDLKGKFTMEDFIEL